jgi:hypothetical protein
MKFNIWVFFQYLSKKNPVSLKSDKKNGYFTWRLIFLECYMFQTTVAEEIKTHILCKVTFFRKLCSLWDNVEKYCTAGQATDDNTIRRLRIVCWITKATDTHSEYVILTAFPANNGYANAPQCYVYTTLPAMSIPVKSDLRSTRCTQLCSVKLSTRYLTEYVLFTSSSSMHRISRNSSVITKSQWQHRWTLQGEQNL